MCPIWPSAAGLRGKTLQREWVLKVLVTDFGKQTLFSYPKERPQGFISVSESLFAMCFLKGCELTPRNVWVTLSRL